MCKFTIAFNQFQYLYVYMCISVQVCCNVQYYSRSQVDTATMLTTYTDVTSSHAVCVLMKNQFKDKKIKKRRKKL